MNLLFAMVSAILNGWMDTAEPSELGGGLRHLLQAFNLNNLLQNDPVRVSLPPVYLQI